jgi:hypothetical protein
MRHDVPDETGFEERDPFLQLLALARTSQLVLGPGLLGGFVAAMQIRDELPRVRERLFQLFNPGH